MSPHRVRIRVTNSPDSLHALLLHPPRSHISVHPGIISTGLYKAVTESYGILGHLARKFISMGAITPEQGSLSSLYAATSPEIDEKRMSGTYLDPLAVVGKKAAWAEDKDGVLGEQMMSFITTFCKDTLAVDFQEISEAALRKQ